MFCFTSRGQTGVTCGELWGHRQWCRPHAVTCRQGCWLLPGCWCWSVHVWQDACSSGREHHWVKPVALILALSVVDGDNQGKATCCASPTAWLSSSAPTRTPALHPHRSRSSSRPPAPPWRPDGGRRARPRKRRLAGRRPWPWITAERRTITLLEPQTLSDVWEDNHDYPTRLGERAVAQAF